MPLFLLVKRKLSLSPSLSATQGIPKTSKETCWAPRRPHFYILSHADHDPWSILPIPTTKNSISGSLRIQEMNPHTSFAAPYFTRMDPVRWRTEPLVIRCTVQHSHGVSGLCRVHWRYDGFVEENCLGTHSCRARLFTQNRLPLLSASVPRAP